VTTDLPFVDYFRPTAPFCGLVIVGEAPGASEVELGQPFVGRSGALLTTALTAAGIDRQACIVANVFRFRPPDNKAQHFFGPAREAGEGGRRWGRYSLGYVKAAFAGELDALSQVLGEAKAVLAVGAVPLWAATGALGVAAHAGQRLSGRLSAAPVFPTYHPAYILRGNYHLTEDWQAHMRAAATALSEDAQRRLTAPAP